MFVIDNSMCFICQVLIRLANIADAVSLAVIATNCYAFLAVTISVVRFVGALLMCYICFKALRADVFLKRHGLQLL